MTTQARTALLIVDVQNDFTEGGSLAVNGGNTVAARITAHLNAHHSDYAVIAASRDWHDPDSDNGGHIALTGTPDYVDTWPSHCISGTHGADYHPDLDTTHVTHHVRKGMGEPAYSMFEGLTDDGRRLADVLNEHGVTQVIVVGLATDYCDYRTALDAKALGHDVVLRADLTAGVAAASTDAAITTMRDHGIAVHGTPATT